MNWEIVNRARQGGSKYKPYWNEMKVFIPETKHSKSFLITPAVQEALGNPEHVLVLTQGDKVALKPCTSENTDAYAVSGKHANGGKMMKVGCGTFIKTSVPQFPYTAKFDAELNGDMVVFDVSKGQRA